MCSLSRLVAHSNQSVCAFLRTVYKLPGKTCSILEEAWHYRRLLSFPGCQEAELGWMVGTNVCLGAVYAVVARAQPVSCILCRRQREATRRGREGGQVRWLPGAWVCLGQALLGSLPRLVDEVSGPNGEVAGVAHLFSIRSVTSLGYSKRNGC